MKKPGILRPRATSSTQATRCAPLMHFQYPTAQPHLACGMDAIPDTPEQLFEQLSEPTLRELFPTFDELPARNQKLVRLIHTELVKGELSDATFQAFAGFILLLWRQFNLGAMQRIDQLLDENDDIESSWIAQANALHRMDQYLRGVFAALEAMPPEDDDPEDAIAGNQYLLRRPEDFSGQQPS